MTALRDLEGVKGNGKLDMFRADPRCLIVQEGYNVRDLTTPDAINKLEELANSIAEIGVTDPLVVRFDGERIIVVEGHRRLAATLMAIERGAEIKSVPIYQEARSVNDAQRDLGLIISNSGEPLTPLEKAKVVGRLVAHGWSQQEIAKRCGWKSVGSVHQYLDMLAMPSDVQQQVRNGDISATTALKVVRDAQTDPAFASELIANMKAENERIGVGKRHKTSTKVTPRNLKRDQNAKAAAKSDSTNGADHSALSASSAQIETVAPKIEERVSVSETDGSGFVGIDGAGADGSVAFSEITEVRTFDAVADEAERLLAIHKSPTHLVVNTPGALHRAIEALAIFAKHAEESCVNERPDDYVVEITAGDLKRAWEAYRAVAGDVS